MMTQLLVRNLEEGLVRRLKARARRHGVAVEVDLEFGRSRKPEVRRTGF
jgi:plasmid stability protein